MREYLFRQMAGSIWGVQHNASILDELTLVLRGIGDTKRMSDTITAEGSAELPEKIQEAERWRLAGKRLRTLAPHIYEQVFALLVASLPCDSDESDESSSESYFRA